MLTPFTYSFLTEVYVKSFGVKFRRKLLCALSVLCGAGFFTAEGAKHPKHSIAFKE
jgi:hypothetical protein